jgi:hypothetical protein
MNAFAFILPYCQQKVNYFITKDNILRDRAARTDYKKGPSAVMVLLIMLLPDHWGAER